MDKLTRSPHRLKLRNLAELSPTDQQQALHEQLEGDARSAALRIVIEWPHRAAATSFMKDPSYVPHLEARTAGSISEHYLIEGKDDLA